MFTGIVEAMGRIVEIHTNSDGSTNTEFVLEASFAAELKVDQSLSHDGVCLTVTEVDASENTYHVTAIQETLSKTTLGNWKVNQLVNLERCLQVGGRYDGHIVQGHVDTTAKCVSRTDEGGSWTFAFEHSETEAGLTVPKGSITVNGVSLTVVDSSPIGFSVAIIPYTFEHTSFHSIVSGDSANIEFDILGKYIARILSQRGFSSPHNV